MWTGAENTGSLFVNNFIVLTAGIVATTIISMTLIGMLVSYFTFGKIALAVSEGSWRSIAEAVLLSLGIVLYDFFTLDSGGLAGSGLLLILMAMAGIFAILVYAPLFLMRLCARVRLANRPARWLTVFVVTALLSFAAFDVQVIIRLMILMPIVVIGTTSIVFSMRSVAAGRARSLWPEA